MHTPTTKEVFQNHLKKKKHHDDFVEDGRMLMSKLENLKILDGTRGRTHGFVIPNLDTKTQTEVLKFLYRQRWAARINQNAKITAEGCTYTYAHIELQAF